MYDVTAFRTLYNDYRRDYMPFLQRAGRCGARTRPYQGLKILHNVPLTVETVFKIEALILAGAELTVTCPSFVEPAPRVVELLENAGVDVQLEVTAEVARDVDVMLDCGGELYARVTPRIGACELTGTGTSRYRKADLDYPVIAVDECRLKDLEALLGTGESFVMAIQQLVMTPITGQPFLVFGYGKVGRGVVRALRRHTGEIGVVDADPAAVIAARQAGCDAMSANQAGRVEAWVQRAFAVVTATGVGNVISSTYDAEAFRGSYLANLGGEDEFGDAFGDGEVLYGKRPVNFACSEPNLVRYLDPVFYAHNTGIDLLAFSNLPPGVHPFPSFLAEPLIELWQERFTEELQRHRPTAANGSARLAAGVAIRSGREIDDRSTARKMWRPHCRGRRPHTSGGTAGIPPAAVPPRQGGTGGGPHGSRCGSDRLRRCRTAQRTGPLTWNAPCDRAPAHTVVA